MAADFGAMVEREYQHWLRRFAKREANEATIAALAPYAGKGTDVLAAAESGGIDFTEAIRAIDDYLAFMKPEAATAPPGG